MFLGYHLLQGKLMKSVISAMNMMMVTVVSEIYLLYINSVGLTKEHTDSISY